VLLIEHNTEVIRSSDWVIDLGPEGGAGGGQIVATGTPADLIKSQKGATAKYL
jgi:excinuclease ABC subunit A